MIHLIRQRLLMLVFVLFGVTAATFLMSHVIPGNPAQVMAGPHASPETVEAIRHQLGLDRPLLVQYLQYMNGLLHGDLGTSIRTQQPVAHDLANFFPATLELVLYSFLIAIVLGIPLGVIAAVKRNTYWDYVVRVFSIGGVSIPVFWSGLVLILIFYAKLGWLPASGRLDISLPRPPMITGLYTVDSALTGYWEDFFNSLWHLLLPAATLSYVQLSVIMRQVRSSMIEVLSKEFILTGRANGLGRMFLVIRYGLRNAMIPTITVIGLSFGSLLGGAVVTETIFDWPGMGHYVVESIASLDFPAIMGFTVVIAVAYVFINLVVDLLYYALDPQIRR
ncbi:MAG: ABC transporter permease [Alicyclobacillaceae bacterium]|nr:ABC transporter permease [Alicyclobacillaceae bacterium]